MMILIRLKNLLIGLLLLPVMPLFALPESSDDESSEVQRARERLEGARERERQDQERNVANSATQRALERAEENLQRTQRRDAQDRAQGRSRYRESHSLNQAEDTRDSTGRSNAERGLNRDGSAVNRNNGNNGNNNPSPEVQRAQERNVGNSATQRALERAEENLQRAQRKDAQDRAQGQGRYRDGTIGGNPDSLSATDLVAAIEKINELPLEERLAGLNGLGDLTGVRVVNSQGHEVDGGEWLATYKAKLTESMQRGESNAASAHFVAEIERINKLPPEERLADLNGLGDLTRLIVVNSQGQFVEAGEWVAAYKAKLVNAVGVQLPEEVAVTPPQATHTPAYSEESGGNYLDWSGNEEVKSARANLVRQGYNVYGLSGEQIVEFNNQVLQAKIDRLHFQDGLGEDEAGPYVGAGNVVGNVVRNPDGSITFSGGTPPAAELSNPATPNLYELAELFGYDPEAHTDEELATLVNNRIAADTTIRDRQIRELANQYIEVLGDEYTDDMDALTDLELIQQGQVHSEHQQAQYEQNLPHYGTEARNWLVRLGVKGAGLMTDQEAIAAVPKEQLKIRLSKALDEEEQADQAERAELDRFKTPVSVTDNFGNTINLDPNADFKPEEFAEAMEQARFNEDTETQAKLVRYFESYGERHLGRSTENDALFDSFGGQRARDAGLYLPAAAVGTAAAPYFVASNAFGVGIGGGIGAVTSVALPTGDQDVPYTFGLIQQGDEGWFELTGDDYQRALQGGFEGALTGGLGQMGGRYALQAAAKHTPKFVSNWGGRIGTEAAGGAGADTGYTLLPDEDGRIGITRQELIGDIALGAAVSPVLDVGRVGYTNVIDPVARTITRAATPTQVTLPSGRVVPLFGGYVPQAMAHGSIPKLLIPRSGSGEAISADVIESLARTGEYHGIIGGTEVTYTPSRLGQAYQAANEGTALYFSSTPVGKVVAAGPEAMAKPGKGYAEQNYFLEAGDATDKFMGRAAFGATGQDPAILVYAEADGPIQRVIEADGSVKYYRNGFEMEKGIRSKDQIPPAERVAAGGIRSGNIYESSSVVAPSFRQRLEANVKAIGDLFTAREAGKFSYASPGDLDAFRVDPTKGDLSPAVRKHIADRIEADQQAAGAAFDAEVASGPATPEMRQARLSEAYDGTIDAIAEEQGLISRAIGAQAEIDAMARTARTEAERIAVSEARARLAEGGASYAGARLGPPRVPGEMPDFRTPPPPDDVPDLRTPPPPEGVPGLRTPPPPEDMAS